MFTTWPGFYVIACRVEIAAVVATWDGTRSSDRGSFVRADRGVSGFGMAWP